MAEAGPSREVEVRVGLTAEVGAPPVRAAPTDSREAGRTREVWGVRRGGASWRGRRGAEP